MKKYKMYDYTESIGLYEVDVIEFDDGSIEIHTGGAKVIKDPSKLAYFSHTEVSAIIRYCTSNMEKLQTVVKYHKDEIKKVKRELKKLEKKYGEYKEHYPEEFI